jgi:tetratricopeptide (TPR) repeat protein
VGACPETTRLAQFVEREVDSAAAEELEEHLDACGDCRRVVAFAVGGLATESLLPGTQVGRYVVRRRLGKGGLGVVYLADDPTLHRLVAVKLLRPLAGGDVDNERLRREAQAMARVDHPNVVAVYDAGTFEGCGFVAMQYVAGRTLAEVLAELPSRRRTLSLFREAAAGLAAVHDAGLVHRDFTPRNVLVGDDGRVRVTDFGLARTSAAEPAAPSGGGAAPRTTIAGTLPYMAPEQHAPGPIDARADQFAFCVVLWEGLCGKSPFAAESEVALAVEKRRGPPAVPRHVPRRLRAVLERGLAQRPEERHDDMRQVERALAPQSGRRAAVAAVAAVLLAFGVCGVSRRAPAVVAASCPAGSEQLAGVWDPDVRERIEVAFARTGAPWSARAFAQVAGALDRYSREWIARRDAACASSLASEDTERAIAALEAACLDDLRRDLGALAGAFAEADRDTVTRAAVLVEELAPVAACAGIDGRTRRPVPPPQPAQRREVDRLRTIITRADALRRAGRHDEALALLPQGDEDRLARLDYEPVRAEWLLARAAALQARVSGADSEAALLATIEAAYAAGHDRVAAQAWLRLTRFRAWQGRELDRADQAARLTESAIRRIGGDPQLEEELALARSFIAMGKGDLEGALASADGVLHRQEARLGATAVSLVSPLREKWRAAMLLGRYREAHEAAALALRIGQAGLGAGHPELADLLHMVGAAQLRLGRLPDAEKALTESVRQVEAVFGADHTKLDFPLAELARLRSRQGRHAEAIAVARRGVAIDDRTFSPGAPPSAVARIALAEVLLAGGRPVAAEAESRRAREVLAGALGADHPLVADLDALLARAARKAPDPVRDRPVQFSATDRRPLCPYL